MWIAGARCPRRAAILLCGILPPRCGGILCAMECRLRDYESRVIQYAARCFAEGSEAYRPLVSFASIRSRTLPHICAAPFIRLKEGVPIPEQQGTLPQAADLFFGFFRAKRKPVLFADGFIMISTVQHRIRKHTFNEACFLKICGFIKKLSKYDASCLFESKIVAPERTCVLFSVDKIGK